ncbi:MAG: hypothetical protein KKI08_15660 [Armatimonadetes bacterium]|nr:hypothetical protein [Armatimonadota bacterium]
MALVLLAASLFWMLQAGIVSQGVQLGEAVPVIPAVGALLLLTVLGLGLRRLSKRLRLSEAQVLYVYVFLCIAVTVSSVGVARLLFPNITAVYYFQTPENDFAALQKHMPTWLAPQDPKVIQDMYEGAPDGRVPWRAWALPLTMWTLFLTAWGVSMLGVMALFRRQWVDKERLTFPIAQLVLDIADQQGRRVMGGFFGNPLMWIGFVLACLLNISNILQAWNPAIPAMGKAYDIGRLFTERPLSAIRPLSIAWRPENIGLGYLVSTEITLSVWVFYLALRLANVMATGAGLEIPGFPFDREQSFGAYVALGLFLVWVGRFQLRDIFSRALTYGREAVDPDEPMSSRTAVLCALGGLAFMLAFAIKAGMLWWTALIYFALVLLFALVYARARAEAGAAMVWLFPFYLHKQMMIHIGGSQPFASSGGFQNLTIFSTFMFVSRGYFQSNMAYQAEAMKIGQEARLRQRTLSWWLTAAVVIGFAGAAFIHLHAYYMHGANILEGGTTQGGYRVTLARTEFEELSGFMKAHRLPDRPRTYAALSGATIVAALVLLRTYFLRFPLHPLGFAMVTAYGGPLWGPFLLVWLIKTAILRLGGMRAYRRGIPFFLGLIVGHFFLSGLVWGWLSIINEMYRRYVVFFG